jgi:hypothetical protein
LELKKSSSIIVMVVVSVSADFIATIRKCSSMRLDIGKIQYNNIKHIQGKLIIVRKASDAIT